MRNTYKVHIYREMRLVFGGIEADTPEAAADLARDKFTSDADKIDDCEGMTLSALVDVVGDRDYEQSCFIDFDEERLRNAAPALLTACRMVVDRWERGDLAEAARACSGAIAQATEETPTCGDRTLTIEVRGGIVQEVSNVPPGWDYEIIDHDNAE
jgi:hypothetical protein